MPRAPAPAAIDRLGAAVDERDIPSRGERVLGAAVAFMAATIIPAPVFPLGAVSVWTVSERGIYTPETGSHQRNTACRPNIEPLPNN
jgi:hypothetical protein